MVLSPPKINNNLYLISHKTIHHKRRIQLCPDPEEDQEEAAVAAEVALAEAVASAEAAVEAVASAVDLDVHITAAAFTAAFIPEEDIGEATTAVDALAV